MPADTAVVQHDGAVWIVMRDVGAALRRRWTPPAALAAARHLASLYTLGAAPGVLETRWLEHDGGSAYAHHATAGHGNLDGLAGDTRPAGVFTSGQVAALHTALDSADAVAALARRLPQTLVHGDFHSRNAGMAEDGTLTLIDWEHVGAGPIGYDLGTFASLYRVFGGAGDLDETELLRTYSAALGRSTGTDVTDEAALGFATVHLTWGLHLRLGPGLTAVREGFHGDRPQDIAPHVDDIRTGCLRALFWAPAVQAAMSGR
ncbi:phosphotransferase family protein [Streptomyces cinereospinus]|uniref:Phosphotransferase family protein n=1 Tax=Streptomyces cinereospinus TaxID=285561 RepID=A0ABV5N4P9_9ACTN